MKDQCNVLTMEFNLPSPISLEEDRSIFDNWTQFYSKYKTFMQSKVCESVGEATSSLLLYAGGKQINEIRSFLASFHLDLPLLDKILLLLEPICFPSLLLMFERYRLASCTQNWTEDAKSIQSKIEKITSGSNFGNMKARMVGKCVLHGDLSPSQKETQYLTFASSSAIQDIKASDYSSCAAASKLECLMKADLLPKESDSILCQSSGGRNTKCASDALLEAGVNLDSQMGSTAISNCKRSQMFLLGKEKLKAKKRKGFLKDNTLLNFVVNEHERPTWTESVKCEDGQVPLRTVRVVKSDIVSQNEALFRCEFCDKKFKSPSLLSRHIIKHSQEKHFSCTVCGHKLKRKAEVNVHMRKHNNQRDYKCTECGKAFMRRDHLKSHMRIHSGEKPYTCTVCNKTFPYLSSLNFHKNCHGTGTFDKTYKYTCEICGKSFLQKTTFTNHLRIHTGEKPYPCLKCDKHFSCKALLKQHTRIHSEELTFICKTCGKCFRHKQNLHVHKKAHSGKRSYVCDLCGAAYLYNKNLKQHKKGVHGMTVAEKNLEGGAKL